MSEAESPEDHMDDQDRFEEDLLTEPERIQAEAVEAFEAAVNKPGATTAGPLPTGMAEPYTTYANPFQPSAELLERPLDLYADLNGEVEEDSVGVPPSGPWVAIAMRDGSWQTGELVAPIEDTLTIRNIFSVRKYLADVLDDEGERQYVDSNGDKVDLLDIDTWPEDKPPTWLQEERHAVQPVDITVSMDHVYTVATLEGEVWSRIEQDAADRWEDEARQNDEFDGYGGPTGIDPRTGFPTRKRS